ncbi:MAG: hypothetical protein LQ338_003971 [Usnochroma carphineum]|nr:MAG: hypothetical protein LQ338_003971 [Usnochroma carphineum]
MYFLNVSTRPAHPSLDMSSSTTLISLLTPPTLTVLEIEILPSSISTTILHSDNCIGIPKPLLLSCFLHARSIFLSHTTSSQILNANGHGNGNGRIATEKEALDATLVILLFDAGYVSAVNFRKRWLVGLRRDAVILLGHEKTEARKKELAGAVRREMIWIESLVTSPLSKHAKSSTLWAHRLWVIRSFDIEAVGVGMRVSRTEEGAAEREEGRGTGFVERELDIVMKAGERHAGNYHAWNYARDVMRLVMSWVKTKSCEEDSKEVMDGVSNGVDEAWMHWVEKMHRWCLGHPRDISGWSFLVFLMGHCPHRGEQREDAASDVFRKTKEFVEKFQWQGKSVDWFLRSASNFHIDPNDWKQ